MILAFWSASLYTTCAAAGVDATVIAAMIKISRLNCMAKIWIVPIALTLEHLIGLHSCPFGPPFTPARLNCLQVDVDTHRRSEDRHCPETTPACLEGCAPPLR